MDRKKVRIGDTYHQWTKYRRDEMSGGGLDWATRPDPYKESPPSWKRTPIESISPQGGRPLWEILSERRSIREFSRQPMTLEELSRLIWATQGITARARGFEFRTVPSAGALYPIETYVVVNRVEGLSPGIHHYDVEEAQLALVREGVFGHELSRAALGQEMLEEAGCVFVWTAVIERSKWKYRERAYRYIYMDAGHIGQNLYLAATALNLGCCTVGAFFDEEMDHLIGIDGKNEISIYLGAVGKIGQMKHI
jgi:SagB-type dehydrogenase family enzyme